MQPAPRDRRAAVESGKYPPGHRADRFMAQGMQEVDIEDQRYDVIWVQWAMLYLTDDDAIAFLQRARQRLRPGGVIVVKENTCGEGFVVDRDDSSITRSHKYMQELFRRAGIPLLKKAKQTDFPKELFDVRMYCLAGPAPAVE